MQELGRLGWETAYSGFIRAENRTRYLAGPFWSVERLRAVIAKAGSHALVAEVAGSGVIGFATFEPRPDGHAELTRLYVHPDFQRGGFGGALLDAGLGRLDR